MNTSDSAAPPQGASSPAWRNPLNRSAWVDAVAVASFAPMTGKVVLDARVVLEANSLLAASPLPAPQEPALAGWLRVQAEVPYGPRFAFQHGPCTLALPPGDYVLYAAPAPDSTP